MKKNMEKSIKEILEEQEVNIKVQEMLMEAIRQANQRIEHFETEECYVWHEELKDDNGSHLFYDTIDHIDTWSKDEKNNYLASKKYVELLISILNGTYNTK